MPIQARTEREGKERSCVQVAMFPDEGDKAQAPGESHEVGSQEDGEENELSL